MKKVTFSGGVEGRKVIFSGGDNGSFVVQEKPLKQVNFLHYPNVTYETDPNLVQDVANLKNRGWGLLFSTNYPDTNKLVCPADTEVDISLEFDANSSTNAELPSEYTTWIDENGKFHGGNLGNDFLIQLFFDYDQSFSKTEGQIIVDLTAFQFVVGNIILDSDITQHGPADSLFKLGVTQTMWANKGQFKLKFDDDVSIYNLRYGITKLSHGRGT